MKEIITLNQKDQARVGVLNLVLVGHCTVGRAAELLGLSSRQVRRLKRRYEDEGVSSLAHGNRGRAPANAVPATLKATITELAHTRMRATTTAICGRCCVRSTASRSAGRR